MSILNFNEALSLIKDLSENTFVFDVWVPSQKKFVKIKEINANQKKNIIDFHLDSNKNELNFIKLLFDIIKENSKEPLDKITIFDYNSIAFSLRHKISNLVKVKDEEIDEIFDLSPIIEKYKTKDHPNLENVNFSNDSVKIEVELVIPTILSEINSNEVFYSKVIDIANDSEAAKKLITSMFLIESSKHIKTIKINEKVIDYSVITDEERLEIMKLLPTTFANNILDRIKEYRDDMYELQTLTKNNISRAFEVTSLLFLVN